MTRYLSVRVTLSDCAVGIERIRPHRNTDVELFTQSVGEVLISANTQALAPPHNVYEFSIQRFLVQQRVAGLFGKGLKVAQ